MSGGATLDDGDAGGGSAPAASVVAVAGVKLDPRGRLLACELGGLTVRAGDQVVISFSTAGRDDGRDTEIGVVAVPYAHRPAGEARPRVVRRADARDLDRVRASAERAAEARAFARERAAAQGLPIKVFRVEMGRGKTVFYFASETRIDFRELVRELAARYHTRIELRQVGVRDEAKMVGGIGSCGRELCCSTFLPRFAPVSIKMAKHQNLAMSPARVSGQCGRLKCCLVYEDATYVEAAAALPKLGKRVGTPDGVGRVGDLDVLRGRVRVYFDGQPPKTFTADELQPAPPPPSTPPQSR
ncbi:MAG TPA: regulatory iron-sulfur-containing complex subunit RicT [Polyangia bacterium]|nr:regulatory iron-sulfur-containing complex subunit RicT [Polyangia bacterium]